MDLFKNLTVQEYVKKTYISKGSTRNYKQFCEDLIFEIGGQDNFISCKEHNFFHVAPIQGTTFEIKVKDTSLVNFIDRLLCSECYMSNYQGQILVTANGLMEDLLKALCKINNG